MINIRKKIILTTFVILMAVVLYIFIKNPITSNAVSISEEDSNSVLVVAPTYTDIAYGQSDENHGFYDYFSGQCDERCLHIKLTDDLTRDPSTYSNHASRNAILTLKDLGYKIVKSSDAVDYSKYKKLIILHSEYVTKEQFEKVTSHPHVLYLYPNIFYAEVEINNNTLSLIRGHGYPTKDIHNGFGWDYDHTHPYEFDTDCKNWKFLDMPNGKILNCTPEKIIHDDYMLLKSIKDY